jgi:hypothetical protein
MNRFINERRCEMISDLETQKLLDTIEKRAENSIDAIDYYNSGFGRTEDLITEILDDLNNIVREINNIKNKRKAV